MSAAQDLPPRVVGAVMVDDLTAAPMQFEIEVELAASPADVFAYIADSTNVSALIDGVTSVRLSNDEAGRATLILEHAPEREVWQSINEVLRARDWPIAQLAAERLSLEQIFLELTDHPLAAQSGVETSS